MGEGVYKGLKDLAYFVEGHLKEHPGMSAYDFCYSHYSQLQYCNINKDIKVCFSNEFYNEEQGIESNK